MYGILSYYLFLSHIKSSFKTKLNKRDCANKYLIGLYVYISLYDIIDNIFILTDDLLTKSRRDIYIFQ